MKITDTHVYFWGGIYSQWYICEFEENGVEFSSAEQYMMYHKAKLFGDEEIASKILRDDDPSNCKKYGRAVKGYIDSVWAAKRLTIVTTGNYLKFSQNPKLLKQLLSTGEKIMVEGSPVDDIWGVKLKWDNPKILDERNWRGLNLLGIALMDARELLQKEE